MHIYISTVHAAIDLRMYIGTQYSKCIWHLHDTYIGWNICRVMRSSQFQLEFNKTMDFVIL